MKCEEEERNKFCCDVDKFTRSYDLISDGQQEREEAARQQLHTLQQVQVQLERGKLL